jgi:putative selenium metabolism hydrolase
MVAMKNITYKIIPAVDTLQDDLNKLLQQLIQIRSYSGEEREIVEFILEKMKAYGFPNFFSDRLGNAVGQIGNGPVKILYDAHIDTVKVTEDETWQYPPFEGKIQNGKIFGRGAVDEKSAMAGFLIAAKVLLASQESGEYPFTLFIVGSVMEEDCDGYPLRHLIEKEGIKPDYVLLGEPTDLQVYRGQRGRMELKIHTQGKSAHGAHNQQGINAIYKMLPIIKQIETLDTQLKSVNPLGKGSITVSQVQSQGPSLCSVPDHCQIHIDRRLTLGETKENVLSQLHQILGLNNESVTIHIPEYRGTSWKDLNFQQESYFPTWVLEEDHPLVRAGVKSSKIAIGKTAKTGFWKFSTNGVATAGRLRIPTIGFAPGKEEHAHTSREEIQLNDLLLATRFYALLPFILGETVNE